MLSTNELVVTVHDMPIDELRLRVREALALLLVARDRVRVALERRPDPNILPTPPRLDDLFTELRRILPGVQEGPRLDVEGVRPAFGALGAAAAERAQWLTMLACLEDNVERAELLDRVSEASRELVQLIQSGADTVRRELELGLTVAQHARRRLS